MQITRRMVTIVQLLACLVAALLASCSLDDTPALRVGANIWPGYEPMYLARSFGYYDAQQIKLIDFPSAVEVMRAYRNGAIDVAALTVDEALIVAATEPDRHRIFLVADYSNGADAILARPSFRSMADLRGRKVGAEGNALGGLMLARALDLAGMTMADVQFVPLPLEEHEAILLGGGVDAVVTFEPRRTRLLTQGAIEVFSSAQIPGEVSDVLIAHETLLRQRDGQIAHLVSGWFRALERQQREPLATAQLSAAHQGVTPEQFLSTLQGLQSVSLQSNQKLLQSSALRRQLTKMSELMATRGLLASAPNIDLLLAPKWVLEAPQ
jgi:NitT/TauT family transport system substrate-binding protein